jgi:hypothetical protein
MLWKARRSWTPRWPEPASALFRPTRSYTNPRDVTLTSGARSKPTHDAAGTKPLIRWIPRSRGAGSSHGVPGALMSSRLRNRRMLPYHGAKRASLASARCPGRPRNRDASRNVSGADRSRAAVTGWRCTPLVPSPARSGTSRFSRFQGGRAGLLMGLDRPRQAGLRRPAGSLGVGTRRGGDALGTPLVGHVVVEVVVVEFCSAGSGQPDLPCPSAEPARGAVKDCPTGPRAASREAASLTGSRGGASRTLSALRAYAIAAIRALRLAWSRA